MRSHLIHPTAGDAHTSVAVSSLYKEFLCTYFFNSYKVFNQLYIHGESHLLWDDQETMTWRLRTEKRSNEPESRNLRIWSKVCNFSPGKDISAHECRMLNSTSRVNKLFKLTYRPGRESRASAYKPLDWRVSMESW